MSDFYELSAAERLDAISAYERATTSASNGLPLPPLTVSWLERVKVALVDDDVSDEERDAIRERWFDYLDGLDDAIADEAEQRLERFARLLDGLLRSDPPPDGDDAQNDGESA